MKRRCMLLGVLAVFALIYGKEAQADSVELTNGDQLHGRVVSVDSNNLRLASQTLGEIVIPRSKVVTIRLGKVQTAAGKTGSPKQPGVQPRPPRQADAGPTAAQLIKALRARGLEIDSLDELHHKVPPIKLPVPTDRSQTPQDVLQGLRTHGLPPGAVEEVETRVPLLAVPKVRSYFNRTLEGLIAGEFGISDLRREAIKARDGLRDIQRDLGPDAAALDGYMMILDGFIERTAPEKPQGPQN